MKRLVTSAQDPPVLDEGTFQQLLAAAYTLQEQAGRLLLSVVPESVRPVSALEPALRVAPADVGPSPPRRDRALFRGTVGKRILLTDELFWKAATVAALAAVSTLLLAATVHRFSPLPAGLWPALDVVQRPALIQRHISTVPAQTCSDGTEMVAMPAKATARDTLTKTGQPTASRVKPASAQKTIVKLDRPRHTHLDEADVVAEDTVIRYRTSSKAPRLQAQTTLVRP